MSSPLISSPATIDALALPSCTVVICTRNRPVELDRCLSALSRLVYRDFEVLVVDNAPADERAREVAARWAARYMIEPRVGLSRARNCGAHASSTEIIAYIDDDCVPEPNWLTGLLSRFDDPSIMAATGQILPLESSADPDDRNASSHEFIIPGDEPKVFDRETPSWFEIANFGGVGNGGNMAFRRRIFDVWPGFDERLGRGASICGGEEHHAFFSLIKRGYKIAHGPGAIVYHPFPVTERDIRLAQLQNITALTGYVSLLFVEEPDFRHETIKFLSDAILGKPKDWRRKSRTRRQLVVPMHQILLACARGPFYYLSSFFYTPQAKGR